MQQRKRILGTITAWVLTLHASFALGTLQPGELSCEHQVNPQGLDTVHPRFSWTLQNLQPGARATRQTAYQVRAASHETLLRSGQADLWDSGKVPSEQSVLVEYAGKPLLARQTGYWQVRVWDERDRESTWSAPATWSMGLLRPADWWPARWIGAGDEAPPLRDCAWIWTREPSSAGRYPPGRRYFRKRFQLATTTNLVQARVLMTADNGFTLWVNGREALRGDQWELTHAARIDSLLVAGENVLAVEVVNAGSLPNEAGLIGKLELQSYAGDGVIVPVDESWQSSEQVQPGWQTAGEGGAEWSGVRKLGKHGMQPWGDIRAPLAPPPVLRREFELTQPVRRATAFICGLGHYELRLNGARVGDRVLDPGWTDYRDTCLYSTYDVTQQLQSGRNAVGVMLGHGMYHVPGGRYVKFTGSFGPPKLILQLHIEHPDGSTTVIGTDEQWRSATGPITFSCVYGGEDYDARRELPGWDRPHFEDAHWRTAEVVSGPGGTLRAQTAPPVKIMQELPTVKITMPQPGVYVYDLGQNFSGWPKLQVRGAAGTTVKLIPGELLDATGCVSQRSSGGPVWWAYTLRGEGVETWAPRFSYYGFRYLQVTGAAPALVAGHLGPAPGLELSGQWLHQSARKVGEFECSNPLLNRIHQLILAAIRCNLQSVLTDCPHREKLGWLEVSHLLGRGLMFNFALPNFYAKVSRDMNESQLANGLVPDIAPEYTVFAGGFRDSPEWGSAVAFNPWQVQEFYGDASLLQRHFVSIQRYADYLASRATRHLVTHGLGDWYDIGPGDPGPAQLTSPGLTATAIYYGDLRIVADAARQRGDAETAAHYARQAEEVRQAFNARFFHPETGSYDRGSQTAQAMPLVLGLVEPAHRASVLTALVHAIRAPGHRVTAGDVGFAYVVRALTEAGCSGVLYDLVTQTNGPGYADQLRKGATTLTEAWNADPRSSQNHCMLGHAEEWFYAGLAGIRPDPAAPGFRRFILRPEIVGDLTWVRAHHDSPYGRIASAWRRTGPQLQWDVIIPPNTRATVFVPARDAHAVQESGKPANSVQGLAFLRAENGVAVFEAGSGNYRFTSELPPP